MKYQLPISSYDYELPDERIAKYPARRRDGSKLLIYRDGAISETIFTGLPEILPPGTLLVFNNTKVVRARLFFFKETGARIEIFCLEPHEPNDYERAFSARSPSKWQCIVGNLKKWKEGTLKIEFKYEGTCHELRAELCQRNGKEQIVRFSWDIDLSFGELLEMLGRIPIPPYLNRETDEMDYDRYQTVYSRCEGSVAAPTAGLHFTPEVIGSLRKNGIGIEEVTLHVGAGTFLPVQTDDAAGHEMHTEYFEVNIEALRSLIGKAGRIIAVGTTSVRTLESMAVLGYRCIISGFAREEEPVGQWEAYDIPSKVTGKELLEALCAYMEREGKTVVRSSTRIMITPAGFVFRIVMGLITNFHQPKSTLLLLIAALVGEDWKQIYGYAMENDFRFLSYGDSSLLYRK